MSRQGLHAHDSDNTKVFYGYVIVAAGCVSLALIFSVHYAFGIFFKPLSTEFGWSRAATSGAFSLVWIVQGLVAIAMGDLNDRVGPRAVLTICGILIGSGYMAMSRITSLWELYLFYGVLVGAGLGGTFVPLVSTAARWFVSKRGLMTGIVAAGVGIGALIGPIAANWLIANHGWRISYLTFGGIDLVGVTIAAQFLKRDPKQMGQQAYGAPSRAEDGIEAGLEGVSVRRALVASQFWIASGVFVCYGFAWTAVLLHLAPHVTDLGMSSGRAAEIVAVLGAASIFGKVLLGMLADKIGNKAVYELSFALMAAALFILVPAKDPVAIFLCGLLFGFAYGGLATAHSPFVAWLFGMKQHGLIFGMLFNGWTIGCALGPVVAGYIFDVTHSYSAAFILCGSICLVGLFLTTFLRPLGFEGGLRGGSLTEGHNAESTPQRHLPAH